MALTLGVLGVGYAVAAAPTLVAAFVAGAVTAAAVTLVYRARVGLGSHALAERRAAHR